MDELLRLADEYALDSIYASLLPPTLLSSKSPLIPYLTWGASSPPPQYAGITSLPSLLPRDAIIRQLTSLFTCSLIGSMILYFSISSLSYYYLFDRRLEHHPKFLPSQVRKEISLSTRSMPGMAGLIVPWFVLEIRGHSRLYDGFPGVSPLESWGVNGWAYMVLSVVAFLGITDFCIYWIHRWLHIPVLYKALHKPHHRWLVPTPFAALAFHPVDGFAQSFPYHTIIYLLPMNKWLYVGLFIGVQCWTIMIHDGDMISGHFLEAYINSPAHHTLHHLYFTCNYGQYFTWADYYNGSYRPPQPELDPIHAALANMAKKEQLALEAENKLINGEGSDSGYEGSEREGEDEGVKKGKTGNGNAELRQRK